MRVHCLSLVAAEYVGGLDGCAGGKNQKGATLGGDPKSEKKPGREAKKRTEESRFFEGGTGGGVALTWDQWGKGGGVEACVCISSLVIFSGRAGAEKGFLCVWDARRRRGRGVARRAAARARRGGNESREARGEEKKAAGGGGRGEQCS
jgi:hypothetical protein